MEEKQTPGAVSVGVRWGSVGGVIGLLSSLVAPFAAIIFAAFVGVSCGRRAATAEKGKRNGDVSGLIAGAIAAPLFVLGAVAGGAIGARQLGATQIATTFSEIAQIELTPDEAWIFYLAGIAIAGVIQAAILIGAAAAAGAWAGRRKDPDPKT